MCIQELSTCKQYRLPIKIVNLNNRYMGMVRQWQEFFYGNRYAESYMDALPDFVKVAEAYGHVGLKIEKPGDVEGALKEGVRAEGRLVFLDFITDRDGECVPDDRRRQGADGDDPGRGVVDMRHILSILVENEAGALSRISGLFSARGYNIESLTVAPTEDATMSRMTIVTVGSDDVIEQIAEQLNRLVEVVKVVDLTEGNHIERELMLVKVRAAGKDRDEMKRLADIFRGRILDVTDKSYTIQLTGTGEKLDTFLTAIEPGVILGPFAPGPRASDAASGSCGFEFWRGRLRRSGRCVGLTPDPHTKPGGSRHEGVLRQGRGPVADQGQEGHDRRLRQPGPCRMRSNLRDIGVQGDCR